ncbi:hypothetical protein K3177_09415 [Qipengyuania sp. GH25]|uniref:Uncharacterized protein n=1 Tax=Qipengyuania pacifica TaxID=2860199 RepID=A0ABS7JJ11_9SPHN|nr:hypothetical protein [Qipengyuania aerophila]MBX7488733.1 hypothetical protein [Qipengyuania aerophila]
MTELGTYLKSAFETFETVSALIVLFASLYAVWLWLRGLLPVLLRLGNGLAKRRIAIFAKGDVVDSLEGLFADSKIFDCKNIIRISHIGDLGRAEPASVFLVYWPDWSGDLDQILAQKRDATALIVYAPQGSGFLPPDAISLLERERNVTLANLRGRLLNDVVVSLITSGYEKG